MLVERNIEAALNLIPCHRYLPRGPSDFKVQSALNILFRNEEFKIQV